MAGRRRRGVISFLIFLLMLTAVLACVISTRFLRLTPTAAAILIVYVLIQATDAFFCGRRSHSHMLGNPTLRVCVGILLLPTIAIHYFPALATVHFLHRHFVWERFATAETVEAMSPTFEANDIYLVHRHQPIARWTVVLLAPPDQPYTLVVRRIVGLPGETVVFPDGGRVSINGVRLSTPTLVGQIAKPSHAPLDYSGSPPAPIKLGVDEYFVIGDNTGQAYDSRNWEKVFPGHQTGVVPRDKIWGRVTCIFWPLNRAQAMQ